MVESAAMMRVVSVTLVNYLASTQRVLDIASVPGEPSLKRYLIRFNVDDKFLFSVNMQGGLEINKEHPIWTAINLVTEGSPLTVSAHEVNVV